jgi:hypothetical protein
MSDVNAWLAAPTGSSGSSTDAPMRDAAQIGLRAPDFRTALPWPADGDAQVLSPIRRPELELLPRHSRVISAD